MNYKQLIRYTLPIIACLQALSLSATSDIQQDQRLSDKEKSFLEYAKSRTTASTTPANDTLSYARSNGLTTKDIIKLAQFLKDYGYSVTSTQDPVNKKNSVNISYKSEVRSRSSDSVENKDFVSNIYNRNITNGIDAINESLKDLNRIQSAVTQNKGYIQHNTDLINDIDSRLQNVISSQHEMSSKVNDIGQQFDNMSLGLKNISAQQKILHSDNKRLVESVNSIKSKMGRSTPASSPDTSSDDSSKSMYGPQILKKISDLEYIVSQILGAAHSNYEKNEEMINLLNQKFKGKNADDEHMSSADITNSTIEHNNIILKTLGNDVIEKIKNIYGNRGVKDGEECVNLFVQDCAKLILKYAAHIIQWQQKYGNRLDLPNLIDKMLSDNQIELNKKSEVVKKGMFENSENEDKYTAFLEKQKRERQAEIDKMRAKSDAIKQARKDGDKATGNTIVEKISADFTKASNDDKTGHAQKDANGIIVKGTDNSAYDEINKGQEKKSLIYRKE